VARLVESESLQSAGELVQNFFTCISVRSARGDLIDLRSQEFHQFSQIRRQKIDDRQAALDFFRNDSQRLNWRLKNGNPG
jgi:hypothetical protein